MDWTAWIDRWGEPAVLAMTGAIVGVGFGFFGQRSRFCLRGAVVAFWHGHFGDKLAVWLLSFASAVVAIQAMILLDWLDVSTARQLSSRGSLSGALVGGLMFGIGMVLTRGCASRLLILSANGNLRALLAGLVFSVAAQAASQGVLVPLREVIAGWWTVEASSRDLLAVLGVDHWGGLAFGLIWGIAALFYAYRAVGSVWQWASGIGAGLMVALAWWATYNVMNNSFEPVQIQGITFSGPSSDWLMRVLIEPDGPWTFALGLLPGVFLGSLIGALIGKEWRVETFGPGYSVPRYVIGAVLMGFGSMMAGGCAVGAGITGGSVFALTAWVTLIGMWLGGGIADRLIDGPKGALSVLPRLNGARP